MAEITEAVGWVVSPVIKNVIEKINCSIEKKYFEKSCTEDDMKKLNTTLLEIQSTMDTVEKYRIVEYHQVQLAREIKAAVHEADYCIDCFYCELSKEEYEKLLPNKVRRVAAGSRVFDQATVGYSILRTVRKRLDRAKTSAKILLADVFPHCQDISPHGDRSWKKIRFLGSGAFGAVYEAIDLFGFSFAAKEIIIHPGNDNQLQQEVSLLSRLQHDNIIRYYGTYQRCLLLVWFLQTEGVRELPVREDIQTYPVMMDEKFWIFLELATQGSLVSQYGKKGLQDSQASAYTLQILHGLIYLNHCKIIHRDIKCANILVDSEGCVKLADFGVAKEIDLLVQKHSLKGTVRWMAPEVAKSTPYGPPADIWSLGCTVLEMLTGHPPHPELTEWQHVFFAVVNGKKPPIPDTLSNAARNFIEECLQVDPQKRPSAIALLEHPFVDHDFLDAGADPGDGGHRPGLRREKKYQRKILKLTETRL